MSEGFNIVQFLKSAVAIGASDEHLKVGLSPFIRKNGFIKKTNMAELSELDIETAFLEMAPELLKDSFGKSKDLDFMFEIKGCSRFRVNYNKQMNKPAMVIRNIPYNIPTLQDLTLPSVLKEVIDYPNGIVLVTGPTGSGKSTTLASMINQISMNAAKHVVTIEDPVEYIFTSKKGIVSQRQLGLDTENFADAIKFALRQDPDVIFIGEIRDKETMEAALKASETGHLVFSTLHTNDAIQTVNRIINLFEESNRNLARKRLAETLRATIAQRLVYSKENDKRYPACEIMIVTPTIKDFIAKDNIDEIYKLLDDNDFDNMVSMNTSLAELVSSGYVSKEEALEHSSDKNELEQMFRGAYQGTKAYYE